MLEEIPDSLSNRIIRVIDRECQGQSWFFIVFSIVLVCGAEATYESYHMDIFIFKMILTIFWPWLIICMIVLNYTNPGILPRRVDYYNHNAYKKFQLNDVNLFASNITAKFKQTYLIRKFCNTCKLSKPLRVHHCSKCNNCIMGMDHHCDWIGNCIGTRTRNTFFVFLVIATMCDIVAAIVTAISTYHHISNSEGLFNPLLYITCIVFSCIAFPLSKLLYFHCKLVVLNMTTIEYIDNKDLQLPSPYNEGKLNNIIRFFFASKPRFNFGSLN